MSKGFLILADGQDYIRMAYALALSIKVSQCNEKSVTLVTNDTVPDGYLTAFDHVISIPWIDKDDQTRYRVNSRWKVYHITPYDETIVLDADTLILDDISNIWNVLEKYELYYTSKVYSYRNELIVDDDYRKAFTANNLPNLYNALHYFKKCDFCKIFYYWVELINNNWELFYGHFVSEYYPKEPSMDVTVALAVKILDCDKDITNYSKDCISFVHMKPKVQKWKNPPESWRSAVGSYFDDQCHLKIGNFKQSGVFHYTEKEFLTDNIIRTLETKWMTV